jgi:hypothetical protein
MAQTSVTVGIDVIFFAPAFARSSTDDQHAKKHPWDSERGCKQAGTLNVILVAKLKNEHPIMRKIVVCKHENRFRHQYQIDGEPLFIYQNIQT